MQTKVPAAASNEKYEPAMGYKMLLDVVTLPVADVDRAKHFYQRLGWRFDADTVIAGVREVQFTPPNSAASVTLARGVPSRAPGCVPQFGLAVEDIEVARDELISRGVEVSEIFHRNDSGLFPGSDPARRSYHSYALFNDPDGYSWLLQEINPRRQYADRAAIADVQSLAQLLHETSVHHGVFEAAAPPHDWWDWYAAYATARQGGATEDEAVAAAGAYMAQVKNVEVPVESSSSASE